MTNFPILVAVPLAAACAFAVTLAAAEPPPETLKVGYAASSSQLGYVTFLGYFSEDEVNDPLWEFARIQRAGMHWCRSESRFKRRDVRWFAPAQVGDRQCAALIYTVECLEPRDDVEDRVNPPFKDGLEQARDTFLSGPAPFPMHKSCSPRDLE